MRKKQALNSSGMTLIEIILMLTIIGTLSAVGIQRFDSSGRSRTSVEAVAHIVASDIRYAQECAMANRISKSITFTSGLSAYTFSPSNGVDPSGQLPSEVTVNSNLTVTFNSLGEPIAGGGGSVTVLSGAQTKTISITAYTGKVNIS